MEYALSEATTGT